MKILFAALLLATSPALAATYARVSGGEALDVISGPSLTAALDGRFAADYNPAPYWTKVPDKDTGGLALKSGAVDNGNGTFTNQPTPVPVMADAVIDRTAFQALLNEHGGDVAAALAAWPQVQK